MKMTKRVLSVLLAVMMVFGCTAFASASFEDVEVDNDYSAAISALSALNLVKGVSETKFGADEEVTRQQMALFITRLITNLKVDASPNSVNKTSFTDLYDATYNDAITHCFDLGIIVGRTKTIFDPKGSVSVDEAITMAVRALGYVDSFYNKNEQPVLSYPGGFRQKAISLGLFENLNDLKFEAPMLRGEVAQLMYNMMNAPIADSIVYEGKPARTFRGLYFSTLEEIPTYIQGTNNFSLVNKEIKEDELKVGCFDDPIKLPEGVKSSDYDACVGAAATVFVKDEKVIFIDAHNITVSEPFYTGYKTATKLNGENNDVLSETYDAKGKLKEGGEYIKVNGKLVKASDVRYYTVDSEGLLKVSSAPLDSSKLYYTVILDIYSESKNNTVNVLQREVVFTKVNEVNVKDDETTYKFSEAALKDITKTANSFGINTAEIEKDKFIYGLLSADGKAFTAIAVAEPTAVTFLSKDDASNSVKFRDGTVVYNYNNSLTSIQFNYTEADLKTLVEYQLYSIGNVAFYVTTTSTASNRPGSYAEQKNINYLVVRNGLPAEEVASSDNSLGLSETEYAAYAYAYVDGALKKIKISHLYNSIAEVKEAREHANDKDFDDSIKFTDEASHMPEAWSKGTIPATPDDKSVIFSYKYDEKTDSYTLYSKNTFNQSTESVPAAGAYTTDGLYKQGGLYQDGMWGKRNADSSITFFVHEYRYGVNNLNGNLGDDERHFDFTSAKGKNINYNSTLGTYEMRADGSNVQSSTAQMYRWKMVDYSEIVVAVKKTTEDGTQYYQYKTYNKANMPSFADTKVISLDGIFARGGDNSEAFNVVCFAKFLVIEVEENEDTKDGFPVDLNNKPAESAYDYSTLTILQDKDGEKVYDNGKYFIKFVGLNLTTLKEQDVLVPADLANKSEIKVDENSTVDKFTKLVIKKGNEWVEYKNVAYTAMTRIEQLAGNIYSLKDKNNERIELAAGGMAILADKDGKLVLKSFEADELVETIGGAHNKVAAFMIYKHGEDKKEENAVMHIVFSAEGRTALQKEVEYNLFEN